VKNKAENLFSMRDLLSAEDSVLATSYMNNKSQILDASFTQKIINAAKRLNALLQKK
jgi:hypothetical protein